MIVRLTIARPGRPVEQMELQEGTWILGREVGDLVLGDPNVSGRHAQLEVSATGVVYTDLGSTNGSFLNGQRLASPTKLSTGTTITLGSSSITVSELVQPPAVTEQGTQVMQARPFDRTELQQGPPALSSGAFAHSGSPAFGVGSGASPGAGGTTQATSAAHSPAETGAAETGAAETGAAAAGSIFSHPTARIRHSYPVAIKDAGLGTAMGLFMKTLPYALVRFGILVSMSVLSIIWFVVTFGGAAFFFTRAKPLGYVWLIVGMATYGWFWRAILRYVLYLIKAGHIAVLTELITKGRVGNSSEGMFAYGKGVVTSRFGQVNAMFALDLLIDGIIRAFNRTLNWIANLLPIPGLSGITSVVNKVVYSATTYVDETMFSYNLARGDDNVWRSSKDGLIYYAQNSKAVLTTGVWIVVLDYVLSAVAWIVMLAPAFVIAFILPQNMVGGATFAAIVIAVLLASNVRSAFLRPLFLTMVMIKFHVSAQNQEINEEWDGRLAAASDKFRELKDKAIHWRPGSDQATEPKPAIAG